MSRSRLILIDAHALCYRSFFAVRDLRTSQGQPTNAVFGFVNILRKILRDGHPDYVVACFDVGKKTRRQERFADYKGHRPSMPDELISQIPLIKEVVVAYQIPILEQEGFEADDVIATIADQVAGPDLEVIIVSGDKDMVQLVTEDIKIFDYRSDEIWDSAKIRAQYGFDPAFIVDFLALAGDATDNIPGVKGIGKITATDLVATYGSLDQIYRSLSSIQSVKIRQKLEEHKDMALLSKELVLLDRKVPLDFDLTTVRVMPPDAQRLIPLFEKLEFRKFVQELAQEPESSPALPQTLSTQTARAQFIAQARKDQLYGFTFSVSEGEMEEKHSLSLILNDHKAVAWPLSALQELRVLCEDSKVVMVCCDMKTCLKFFDSQQLSVRNEMFDVLLAGYLLEPAQTGRDLAALSWKYLRISLPQDPHGHHTLKVLLALYRILDQELHQKELANLFYEVERPLAHVLFQMEKEGVAIDGKFLNELSKQTHQQMEDMTRAIYQLAGEDFNINSPKQLSHILFEKFKLPVIKKTKTGFSTDEDVLHRLAPKHPLPQAILQYRQLSKLTSTYIDALPSMVNPQTQRVHAEFDQSGTETGRLSSRNPNLQNIPVRTDLGRQIRKAFIARDKQHVMVSGDYSQIELRILAHLSQDQHLLEAFVNGEDIHTNTAMKIFNVACDAVTSEMRTVAKRINFGIVYGMSAYGLAKDLGVNQTEAQEFIDKYFLQYPGVPQFMQDQIHKAERDGFVTTLLHRRRYIPDIHSDQMALRQFAQRQALNTPVQGTAADLIKVGMIQMQRALDKEGLTSKMTITVHDELVFDALRSEQDHLIALIRQEMESPLKLAVPIKVSIKVGVNWLEMKEVDA